MESVKIGLISDTHGNLPALLICLEQLEKQNCNYVVHLGDIISIGAFSRECAELLLNRENTICVLGNHDKGFVKRIAEHTANSHVTKEHKQHVYAALNEQIRENMERFPYVFLSEQFEVKVAFTHYARMDDGKFYEIDKFPTAEKYDEMFKQIDADIIIFGHTHKFGIHEGKCRYINLPSIGCRSGSDAFCYILTINGDKTFSLQEFSLPYDKKRLFDEMDRQNLPDKELMKEFYFNFKP